MNRHARDRNASRNIIIKSYLKSLFYRSMSESRNDVERFRFFEVTEQFFWNSIRAKYA